MQNSSQKNYKAPQESDFEPKPAHLARNDKMGKSYSSLSPEDVVPEAENYYAAEVLNLKFNPNAKTRYGNCCPFFLIFFFVLFLFLYRVANFRKCQKRKTFQTIEQKKKKSVCHMFCGLLLFANTKQKKIIFLGIASHYMCYFASIVCTLQGLAGWVWASADEKIVLLMDTYDWHDGTTFDAICGTYCFFVGLLYNYFFCMCVCVCVVHEMCQRHSKKQPPTLIFIAILRKTESKTKQKKQNNVSKQNTQNAK